ncbi:hypothetical protein EVAR_103876_1 [Eumeta japonica]|uniref:Uncharacterized protein n=1 Tax=Eumeta variegata TaxID=151549 RepID=A0A4C2A942_EUMVA|nr:hypothetical protein EVAR_103876_1 [Eumeta japonica]
MRALAKTGAVSAWVSESHAAHRRLFWESGFPWVAVTIYFIMTRILVCPFTDLNKDAASANSPSHIRVSYTPAVLADVDITSVTEAVSGLRPARGQHRCLEGHGPRSPKKRLRQCMAQGYSPLTRQMVNALITPLEWRVSVDGGDHLLSGGLHGLLPLENAIYKKMNALH